MTTVLAIDIGGTKLAVGLVARDGTVLAHDRAATPPGADSDMLWAALAALVDGLLERDGTAYDGVGIGCGGPMLWPQGVVSPLNIPGWRDFPLLERVRATWGGGRPVAIHNDAVALAVAEHRWGAGRGHDHVLGMVVSTGVGGGLVIGGRRDDGASGNAGHIGHVVVEPDGPLCPCGGRGCLEAVARGPAIAADAAAHGWTGEQTGVAVAEGARQGDPACIAAFERAGHAVAVGIASAIALLDLEVVAVGGGISQAGEVFWGPLRAGLDTRAGMEFVRRCHVAPAQLGPLAGLSGAAALVLDDV